MFPWVFYLHVRVWTLIQHVGMWILQYCIYAVVDKYGFDFLQWQVDKTLLEAVHVLMVLVQITCI
jgi:hypothetical protein